MKPQHTGRHTFYLLLPCMLYVWYTYGIDFNLITAQLYEFRFLIFSMVVLLHAHIEFNTTDAPIVIHTQCIYLSYVNCVHI
jgi:hypothetical protein